MEEVVLWTELLAVIEPFYLKGRRGRPPLTLLVHAKHHGGCARAGSDTAHDVAHLLHEERVGGELEIFLQMRPMAFWLSPLALAMVRVLQCVAFLGRVSKVRVTTASTRASVILRVVRSAERRPKQIRQPAFVKVISKKLGQAEAAQWNGKTTRST